MINFSIFTHLETDSADVSYSALYDNFMELCKIADDAGMHAIWTGEHHGMNFTIAPNPFISIAALARETTRVRLGTGTIVAPFWHPIKLAEEAAMTDIITEGRLDIGIARGAYSFEYERLLPGLDAWDAGQRMREIIPAIKKLWAGDYAHEGKYHQFPSSTAIPRPVQQDGPPIWVAARDPNSHEFAVAEGCHVQVTPLWQGMEEITQLKQHFDGAVAKCAPAVPPQIMLLHHTFVGRDDADVEQAARELSRFFCYFGSWFKNERPVSGGFLQPLTDDEMQSMAMCAPEKLRQDLTIGTVAQVVDRVKTYRDMGFTEYSYWLDSMMPHARKKESLLRFIDEVIPKIN